MLVFKANVDEKVPHRLSSPMMRSMDEPCQGKGLYDGDPEQNEDGCIHEGRGVDCPKTLRCIFAFWAYFPSVARFED